MALAQLMKRRIDPCRSDRIQTLCSFGVWAEALDRQQTGADTRQALQERLLAKEEFLYRVEQQCARDLFVGNRMSVRRACRVAVADRRLR